MNTKKSKNPYASTKTPQSKHFQTLLKSRASKETIRDMVHLSANLQENLSNEDARSVKSSISVHKKTDFESNPTQKIKSFVRNMKIAQQSKEQPAPVKIPKTIENSNLSQSRTSVRSSRSIRSTKSNFASMHLEKDLLDNKSVISTRSIVEEGLSRSKILFSKQDQEASKQKIIDRLNKMEQKMDYLVRNKLKNLMLKTRSHHRYSPKPFLGARGYTPQIDQLSSNDGLLEKQLQSIVDAISSLKQKESDQTMGLPQLQQNISELDKKIQLLEKILASNFTEAQILRKFYFAQKSQKCPHLTRKQRILDQISKRKEMLKTNASMLEMRDLRNKPPILRYESSSKYFFTKPSQAAYVNPRNNSKPFIANRQPLPRSTYDREYLNYGTLPVFNYKPHDSKYSCAKLNVKTSNYQEAFKEKHMDVKQLNYKELDCYKDKIKFGSISFSQMYKNKSMICKKSSSNLNKEASKEKENKNSIQKAIETLNNLQKLSKLETTNMKLMGGTEMKREFVWHSPTKTDENEGVRTYGRTEVIKDGKLNNLKAAYKMEFLR